METPTKKQESPKRVRAVVRDGRPVCKCGEFMVLLGDDGSPSQCKFQPSVSSPLKRTHTKLTTKVYGCYKTSGWCGVRENLKYFEANRPLYKTVPSKPSSVAMKQRSITDFLATPSTSGGSASRGRLANQDRPTGKSSKPCILFYEPGIDVHVGTPATPTRASLRAPALTPASTNTSISNRKRSTTHNGEEESSSKKQRLEEKPAEDTVARKLNFSDAHKKPHDGENVRPPLLGAKDIVKTVVEEEVNGKDETPASSNSSGRRSTERAPLADADQNRL